MKISFAISLKQMFYIKLLSDVFFYIYMIIFKEKKCIKPKSQKVK